MTIAYFKKLVKIKFKNDFKFLAKILQKGALKALFSLRSLKKWKLGFIKKVKRKNFKTYIQYDV